MQTFTVNLKCFCICCLKNEERREDKSILVTVMDASVVISVFLFAFLYPRVQCSMKKGLCVAPKLYKCDDLAAFPNLYWWYDWGANFDEIEKHSKCDLSPYIDKYVPMVWGYRSTWSERVREVDKTNTEFILGFNEPNHQLKQANLTPEEAAAAWHLVEAAAPGSKIVSPAAAECGSNCHGSTIEWFDKFFEILCRNETTSPCRVDYLATHVYSCSPDATMNFLKKLHTRYNLKIWLTEFACPNSDYPLQQLYGYMKPLLNMLEKEDYIYRYAWYMARSNDSYGGFVTQAVSLLEQSTSQLTELGEYYSNFYREYTTTTKSTTTKSTTTSSTSSSTRSTATTTTSTSSTSSTKTTEGHSTTTITKFASTTESGSDRSHSTYISVGFSFVCIIYYVHFIFVS